MVSNHLADTHVEILSGSALVEANEILRDNHITVKVCDTDTLLLKTGLYHFNADTGQVRAFEGKAQVSGASNSTELKGGHTLLVGSSLTPDKFDRNKSKDQLYAWSVQRDQRLEVSNLSVARGLNSNSFSNSLWAWDPWMGTYTYLPRSGYSYNPCGIAWYSPATVWIASLPGNGMNQGNSSYGVNTSSQGYTPPGTTTSSPSSRVDGPTVVQTQPMGTPSSAVPSGAVARMSPPGR